jgi:Flp pilus assembly protein TadD/Zn-dependent protease
VALRFRLLGVPIAIGLDFIVLMVVLGSLWRLPEELPAWLAVVTGSVLLHELGHAAMFDYFGVRPAIRLYAGGGMTTGLRVPPRQHILVAGAGPAMGLIVGGLIGAATIAAPRLASEPIVQDLLWVNLGWSLINLLPFPGSDGGAILSEMTALVLGRPAEQAGRVAGLVVVGAVFVGLVLAGLYDWAFIIGFVAVFSTIRMGALSDLMVGKSAATAPGNLMAEGRYQEAFNAARLAMADHPADIGAVMIAADALRLMTSYADAEWGYNRALQSDPTLGHALRGRHLVRLGLGREAEANSDLAALMALPRATNALFQASALAAADRPVDGRQLVLEALGAPQSPPIQRALLNLDAVYLYLLGRHQEALAHTDALLHAQPGEPAAHELRALILVDLGRFDEALAEARRALSGAPKHPEYHQTLGLTMRLNGDAAGALPHLVESAVGRPNGARPRGELIACYAQLGQMAEARAALETLPRYAARDPFVAYALAGLSAVSGSADDATGFLRQAAAARPELAVRAGVDPLFRTLFADPARRAAIGASINGAIA